MDDGKTGFAIVYGLWSIVGLQGGLYEDHEGKSRDE
jgi:hypothetical protein